MTLANPQTGTNALLVFKTQREAFVPVPYEDGKFKSGPRIGELKYTQGIGTQWNYTLDREVKRDDPAIDVKEAVAWLRAGTIAREVDVNRALEVIISDPAFDAMCSCYFQKGNVPLPDGLIFLKEVGGLFNAGNPIGALAAFMRYNSGANNVPTKGHSIRRAKEILMGWGDYGKQDVYPYFPGNPHDKSVVREMRPVTELGLL